MEEINIQENRGKFLDNYKKSVPRVRRNIFDDYEQVNSYELELPNTHNKLVLSLHKKKSDGTEYLLRWAIGQSSMFIDAKTSFIVSEAMRYLTADVVPDELKLLLDAKESKVE